ncbi:TRAP transporter substrate-binding protein [Roseburia sp. 1XD42-69]|uniref:TRAP transporter substrate-binding protein n=1 Tax=Roseburia sp. 1XD42-69 TaxID=2320088 RepID=UPI000EA01E3A|nr:TRAP transporter substrate-binding protein [Roseburia sp. 1XD42-69]RKJ63677.1 C4-dicarboxylate ABC transporter substrate-binding protein [Roseburia sp. 1XD42-69]
MKKKLLSALLCAAMTVSMTACGLSAPEEPASDAKTDTKTDAPADEKTDDATEDKADDAATATAGEAEVVLTFAEVNPLDTIVGQMDTAFKDKVEELSGGQIQIDLQASGVLGAEQDVLDSMLGGGGTIQMSRISAFALTNYGGQKSSLLSVPFTFVSRDHFWKFAESDLAEEILMEPHENGTGVRGLFYGEEGFRHFFTVKEVADMEDLSGMKIRVSNDPIMNGLVEGLGASPTVVSFGELYSALQTGVVDAAEQPIANYKSNAFQEVAPNLILDGHTLGAVQVIITDQAWDSLTEEQQGWITEASEYASNFCHEISEKAENEVLEELKGQGVNVVEVSDITKWQEACKKVIEDSTKDNAELYQKIVDMK